MPRVRIPGEKAWARSEVRRASPGAAARGRLRAAAMVSLPHKVMSKVRLETLVTCVTCVVTQRVSLQQRPLEQKVKGWQNGGRGLSPPARPPPRCAGGVRCLPLWGGCSPPGAPWQRLWAGSRATKSLGIGINFTLHKGKMQDCEISFFRSMKALPRAVEPEEVWPLTWLGTGAKPNKKVVCEGEIVSLPWPYICGRISLPLMSKEPQSQKKDDGEKVEKVRSSRQLVPTVLGANSSLCFKLWVKANCSQKN